jgi:ATP-dependent DNA ligase
MCPFSEVHRIGPGDFKYFTRNNIDFGPRGYDVLDRLFTQRLAGSRCVLDGELVIWNKATKRFVPFGGTPSTLKLLKNAQKHCFLPHYKWIAHLLLGSLLLPVDT